MPEDSDSKKGVGVRQSLESYLQGLVGVEKPELVESQVIPPILPEEEQVRSKKEWFNFQRFKQSFGKKREKKEKPIKPPVPEDGYVRLDEAEARKKPWWRGPIGCVVGLATIGSCVVGTTAVLIPMLQNLLGIKLGADIEKNKPGSIEEERKIATDKTNEFDFQQIARIGLEQSDIHLDQISDPEIINPVFLRMSAEYGNDWLLPPAMDGAGKVSEAAYNDWVVALQLDPSAAAEFKVNYPNFRDNPQLFSKFLLNHGASQRLVDFLLKADELITQDKDPGTWQGTTENPDRYEFLQQWLEQQTSLTGQGFVKEEGVEQKGWSWVEPIYNIAENVGVKSGEILGQMATLRAEWQHDLSAMNRQLKVVEMAAEAMPDEKMALYAGFAATHADWIMSCVMVGLVAVGLNRNPAMILVDNLGKSIAGTKEQSQVLMNKLAKVGGGIMVNLREKSTDFKEWMEEKRREKNSRQLVNRLRNGLSLSREFVVDLGGILNNPQNQDLRDLVLTEGPNWFRHLPENHPETPQILRFFGCRDYSELRDLADQPDKVVNRLYTVLVGSGKKADLRKTEQVKELIALYKKASGFSGLENQ